MITNLRERSLLKVFGPDSEGFLQSQFSNDIKHIKENHVQINAYCQHQGKIIAIIWVFKREDCFYLSLPCDLKEIVLSKLNMFKLMSRVEIEDYSTKIKQFGLVGENRENSLKITDNLSLITTREQISNSNHHSKWEYACVNNKLPEVYANNSESFIPQALDLDVNLLGVSFTKGCYPGQEVVARMHYLGKPKRRLFRFHSNFKVVNGDNLNVDNSKSLKSSGNVIRVAKKDGRYYFLATFEVSNINENVFLNNDKDKPVNIIYE